LNPAYAPTFAVREVVVRALAEDVGPLGDLTTALLPVPDAQVRAAIVARADGVLAGRQCAVEAFAQVDPSVGVVWHADDGDPVTAGRSIAIVTGPIAGILTAERTVLNLLSHLSGVATLTRRFVDALMAAAPDAGASVRDTRKTTPGLRALEKAAVRAGGGRNHRGSLSDGILVKDNHLAGLTIDVAVAKARVLYPGREIEVECDSLDQVRQAALVRADLILLDNMSPAEVATCAAWLREALYPGLIEVSGRVTVDNVGAYAVAGAKLVAVGALTHSAPILDIGLDLR